jgi:hypothetical protein
MNITSSAASKGFVRLVEIAETLSERFNKIDGILSIIEGKRDKRFLPKDPSKAADLQRVQALYDQKIEEVLLSGALLMSLNYRFVNRVKESNDIEAAAPIFHQMRGFSQHFSNAYDEFNVLETQLLDLTEQNWETVISNLEK